MPSWWVWLLVAVGIWAVSVIALFVFGRRLAARELAVLLPNVVRMCRTLVRDPRVPIGSKVLLGLATLWFVSPIDLVPEFIPLLGPLDDVLLAAFVLRHVARRAGRDALTDAWPGEAATLERMLRLARVP